MNLPQSRWPVATRIWVFEAHSPSLTLSGPVWIAAPLTSEPVLSERTPLISVRQCQTTQSSQVAANIDSSILAEDLSKRLCVIVMSNRGHHVLAVLSTRVEKRCMFFHPCRKTGEVTFRTAVFCSNKMVLHNRAADGRHHCARSLEFCRVFFMSVARLAFTPFLPGTRRIPSCAMTQKTLTFLHTTAGENDRHSHTLMFPAVSHLHTHSNHD